LKGGGEGVGLREHAAGQPPRTRSTLNLAGGGTTDQFLRGHVVAWVMEDVTNTTALTTVPNPPTNTRNATMVVTSIPMGSGVTLAAASLAGRALAQSTLSAVQHVAATDICVSILIALGERTFMMSTVVSRGILAGMISSNDVVLGLCIVGTCAVAAAVLVTMQVGLLRPLRGQLDSLLQEEVMLIAERDKLQAVLDSRKEFIRCVPMHRSPHCTCPLPHRCPLPRAGTCFTRRGRRRRSSCMRLTSWRTSS